MILIYGIATPKSDDQKAAMTRRIGRDHFYFIGDPTECIVTTPQGNIAGLRWDFKQLDPMIRLFMTLEFSRQHYISLNAADRMLSRDGAYFIQADLELTYTDQQPEQWATVYQRKDNSDAR